MPPLPDPIEHIAAAIDAAYERKPTDARRGYLGASVIGDECERKLWYGFRWSHEPEGFDGRKLRLFETGHREEARLLDYLRLIGCEVDEIDPSSGKQFGVSAIGGHFRGHLDGEATNIPGAPVAVHVIECKTHNEKSFKALQKDKVEKAKPAHFAQMQVYMHLRGHSRALYLAVNKNTDELHAERVHYDPGAATRIMAKAERVIKAERAPPKLHDDPSSKAAWLCNYCPARPQCHEKAFAPRSCRSCLNATAIIDDSDKAAWHCARWDKVLTLEEQRQGCPAHLYLPDLVPGEQVDATSEPPSVTYKMPNGDLWTDTEAA